MTVAQIEAQFESEWVLVEDPQTNEALEVQSGTLCVPNGGKGTRCVLYLATLECAM